jgi:hypothetical protein
MENMDVGSYASCWCLRLHITREESIDGTGVEGMPDTVYGPSAFAALS